MSPCWHQVAKRFKDLYTLIPQDDTLLHSLTPLETLTYIAELRLPQHWTRYEFTSYIPPLFEMTNSMTFLVNTSHIHRAKKHNEVMRVLSDLSLTGCCKNRVGNVDRRGISGGERKRVSIGCEVGLLGPAPPVPTLHHDTHSSPPLVSTSVYFWLQLLVNPSVLFVSIALGREKFIMGPS